MPERTQGVCVHTDSGSRLESRETSADHLLATHYLCLKRISQVAPVGTELLILLPQPRSVGITGVDHHTLTMPPENPTSEDSSMH